MTLPTFDTVRLAIKPRTFADLEACLKMDRDPEVTKYVPGPWHDPASHEAFVRERLRVCFGRGLGYWSVFANKLPNDFIGWILLIPQMGVGPDIEIGWRFKRSAWGKGYATEAAHPVLEHAFKTLGLQRVVADIHAENSGSIRVAQKLGMIEEDGKILDGTCHRAFAIHR
ncbi:MULTISPECIES: GNAT family N-acetyltransferase [unclassified Halomonas]|uniref:GNAT family N-acetyltransferase n=1 Tax=unclassified Halomonas TaxID=2609666 RepID=UPI0020A15B6A|nr:MULTISPECIES: GNAT family N-acetyltransferase [unclassified Halomonas]MCP1315311.1 GNAT family N-acetyltransferase [Halomonas sp. 707D7]MCP1327043.1 GNAT family N-acetyltransferase [Halomonas sp. 707D4]